MVVNQAIENRKHGTGGISSSWKTTDQGDTQREETGVDEEEVSTDLNDVEEQRGYREQDALGHSKLLHSVLQEESQSLEAGTNINGLSAMDNIAAYRQ